MTWQTEVIQRVVLLELPKMWGYDEKNNTPTGKIRT